MQNKKKIFEVLCSILNLFKKGFDFISDYDINKKEQSLKIILLAEPGRISFSKLKILALKIQGYYLKI